MALHVMFHDFYRDDELKLQLQLHAYAHARAAHALAYTQLFTHGHTHVRMPSHAYVLHNNIIWRALREFGRNHDADAAAESGSQIE